MHVWWPKATCLGHYVNKPDRGSYILIIHMYGGLKPHVSNTMLIIDAKTLPVKLQLDASIIIFTRSCNILPFNHDLVQKVKKVRQRSTSNSSEILIERISL